MRVHRFLLIVLVAARPSPSQSCSAWESRKSIAGTVSTFELDRYPWKVTTDLDANVTIQNRLKKSKCATKLESVVSVYFGGGRLIYLRSADIASDEMITLDGFSCKEAMKAKRLDPGSEAKTGVLIRSLGICKRP